MIHCTKRISLFLLLAVFVSNFSWAQKESPVLMNVGGTPITLEDFDYLYKKTNAGKTDYTRASLEEYLSMFINFRLKVQRAYDMKLDTVPSLSRELASYRKSLSDSYLIDREVTDRLIREVYDHSQEDVRSQHIMILIAGNTPADTLAAFNKAQELYKRASGVKSSEEFASLAKVVSEDKNTKDAGGSLGWLSPMLPSGFYALENAIFSTPVGTTSKPVRSPMGYHIVYVAEKRPARGEIEIAHILIRDSREKPNPDAKTKIEGIYSALQAGGRFEDVATANTEDANTKEKGGYLGIFGINRYEESFENAAFGLKADGEYTKPVKTSIGWHIIKRVSLRSGEAFDIAKNRLKPKVQRDDRYRLARLSMIERIKKDAGFNADNKEVAALAASLDSTFITTAWRKPANISKGTVLTVGERKFTTDDFADYLLANSRRRTDAGRNATPAAVAQSMFADFTDESVLKFEEGQLEEKYPEFRFLMNEYRDGMLLFEATKMLIWDRASQDSVGLEAFYEANKQNYTWKDRAVCSVITMRTSALPQQAAIMKSLRKKGVEATLKQFNATEQVLFVREETIERDRNPQLDAIKSWKPKAITAGKEDAEGKTTTFYQIKSVTPKTPKSLKEARGFVVADYQDKLEATWIEELKKLYPVSVNKEVFESLIK